MSFLAWIILGLIAGFIGSKIVNKRGEGLLLDIVFGNRWSDRRRMALQHVWRCWSHRVKSVQPPGGNRRRRRCPGAVPRRSTRRVNGIRELARSGHHSRSDRI